MCLGFGLVCLLFARSLVQFSFFREAVWDAWRTKVAGDLSSRACFRGGRYLDFRGSLKLLSSPHLRRGDKGLLRGILSGGVWNGFLLSFVRGEIVPCRFCGGPDGDGGALISLLFTFVKIPNFVIFCFVTGVLGLGVFLGMGGCLHLLVLVGSLLGLPRMMMLLVPGWRGC